MSHDVPTRRNFESLKKEAKKWLASLRLHAQDARARLDRALPNAPAEPTLRDVQHALAREHGFAGWTELKQALTPNPAASAKTIADYDTMAQTLLEAYLTGTPEAMERLYHFTWHRRPWQAMRTYVQLELGSDRGQTGVRPGSDPGLTPV